MAATTVQKDSFGPCFSLERLNRGQFGLILPVTRFAFTGSWLVEEDSFSIRFANQFVTAVTRNPAMRTFQRKWGALVMVEFRRFPTSCVVTAGAGGRIFARGKLARVRVGMAFSALFWSSAEVHVFQTGLKRWGTMTVATGYSPVRTQEREFRFRMVKPAYLFPGCGGMASFAACSGTILPLQCHPFAELPIVWIHVATGAGTVLKPEFNGRCWSSWNGLMAIRA